MKYVCGLIFSWISILCLLNYSEVCDTKKCFYEQKNSIIRHANGTVQCSRHNQAINVSDYHFNISFRLHMTPHEKILFGEYLSNITSYLEIGCGGSTLFVCNEFPNVKKISCIDGSKDWIDLLQNFTSIQKGIEENRVQLQYVDIGPTGHWGMPKDHKHSHNFPNYSESVVQQFNESHGKIDLVLVDGRFRVATALKAIQSIVAHNDTGHCPVIVIHDFVERWYYHVVLKYADVIDCADSLVILAVKENIDMHSLRKDIVKHEKDVSRR